MLSQTSATLEIGTILTLTATVLPDNATNKTIIWSSSNPAVASVFYNGGTVFGLTEGTTSIIATTQDGNKTATCVVTVISIPVDSVELDWNAATMQPGDTLILTATVYPNNATNKNVTWTSSDITVATVNNGTIITIADGFVVITAVTQDGDKTATCSLTIVTLPPPIDIATCNTLLPGWGTSFGIITRGGERTISGSGITQIWSDAVTTTNCNKTTYSGGSFNNHNADCRSNPNYPGDLFSWCAVARYAPQLCPVPWRVPTLQDFRDLDIALGGIGSTQMSIVLLNRYLNDWGGTFGGSCYGSGGLLAQGQSADYWSQSEPGVGSGYLMTFMANGYIFPHGIKAKVGGSTLRCVRDH
ncbi:MAG: Ig-like domain-containing protein [Bacteroidales bacterium]|nr:Ig-like domain-containing protein [Bacteroidales bacterium]